MIGLLSPGCIQISTYGINVARIEEEGWQSRKSFCRKARNMMKKVDW
jgi:hypothetical protein